MLSAKSGFEEFIFRVSSLQAATVIKDLEPLSIGISHLHQFLDLRSGIGRNAYSDSFIVIFYHIQEVVHQYEFCTCLM